MDKKPKLERRFAPAPQIRAAEGTAAVIFGHAAVFNQVTDLGFYREMIAPGAFTRTLAEGADVRALVEHDPARILGRTKPGTLRLSEDQVGLLSEIDAADTSIGRDTVTSIRRGDLDQMSFGFFTMAEKWEKQQDDVWLRTILDVDLFDVSVVAYAAYPQTDVGVRSFPEGLPETVEARKRQMAATAPPLPEPQLPLLVPVEMFRRRLHLSQIR